MCPTMATKKAMKARSCSRMETDRSACEKYVGHQSTMPESSSASAPTAAAQKKNFWPALYLPTLGSSLSENFMYSSTVKRRSFFSNILSRDPSTNHPPDAGANATPRPAGHQRPTERAPKREATPQTTRG